MNYIKITSIVILFFLSGHLRAQQDSTNRKSTIIPLVYYLPETKLAFGVTGITTFRFKNEPLESPVSRISYVASYTLKNQILLFTPFEFYQKNGKIRHKGEIGYYKFFYDFYGIGPNALAQDLENYDVLIPRVEYNFTRELKKNWSIGAGFKFDNYNITEIDSAGLLETTMPIGYDGGIKMNSILVFRYDTRNHYIRTSKGFATEIQLERSLNFLSDFNYWRLNINPKYFIPIGRESILGFDAQFFASSAGTPFFDLPHMGKSTFARGFSDRRYIDRNMITFQYEYRFPIYKRLKGNTFASATYLSDELDQLFEFDNKLAIGAGIRFLLNPEELTSIAFDVGRGDKFNFYLTINEAF